MLYQMAELLIRYPTEADRLATPEAQSNPFLVEAPVVTVAQWPTISRRRRAPRRAACDV
jgi:hypothetical protein